MPNEVVSVEVRSNVDALSAEHLHRSLFEMVQRTVEDATMYMRAVEPKDTGRMEEHTKHTDAVDDLVGTIEARLGITPIEEAGSFHHGDSDSSHYPVFVDQGTGIFGETRTPIFAKHVMENGKLGYMHFEGDHGEIFTQEVKGQRPHLFIAATMAFAEAVLHSDPHIRIALDEMAAEAAAMLPEEIR